MYDFQGSYTRVTDMALLTEGGLDASEIYKHCPPDGGRTRFVVDVAATKWQPLQVTSLITPLKPSVLCFIDKRTA